MYHSRKEELWECRKVSVSELHDDMGKTESGSQEVCMHKAMLRMMKRGKCFGSS